MHDVPLPLDPIASANDSQDAAPPTLKCSPVSTSSPEHVGRELNAAIVIPCYNEAERLRPDVYLDFLAQHPNIELILVNDGSRDATDAVLTAMRERSPSRITVASLHENRGKAEAVRQGVQLGFGLDVDAVGFWDADLATPLDAIPDFLRVLSRNPSREIVIGSRLPLAGRTIRRNRVRGVLGRIFATVASTTLSLNLRDTQCGAKLFRVTERTRTLFATPFLSRWIFDVELFARYRNWVERAFHDAVYELPLDEWTDMIGSNIQSGDFVQAAGELSKIWWRHRVRGVDVPDGFETGDLSLTVLPATAPDGATVPTTEPFVPPLYGQKAA